jgi:hypothetical protein
MKNPDEKVLEHALRLHNDGKKMHEILEITGLNYSQAWAYINDAILDPKKRVKPANRTPETVKRLRDSGTSWGMISVMFGYTEFPESKIRKMFEDATGLKSQGLRIARGGRFLNKDPLLYLDERRKSGIELKVGTSRLELAEISAGIRGGHGPAKVKGVAKKVAKATGAVKAGGAVKKTATKKAVAKKVAKKAAKVDVDPFE